MSAYGTTQTLMAIKIRDDATLPVGTLLDGINSVDLFCFGHSNGTETSDGFKTQNGSRSIIVDEPPHHTGHSASCLADHDTNENVYASIRLPDGTWIYMNTGQGDSIIFQVADNFLTYSCDMANGVDAVKISYDLK